MLSLVRILGEDLKSLLVNNHQHVITKLFTVSSRVPVGLLRWQTNGKLIQLIDQMGSFTSMIIVYALHMLV